MKITENFKEFLIKNFSFRRNYLVKECLNTKDYFKLHNLVENGLVLDQKNRKKIYDHIVKINKETKFYTSGEQLYSNIEFINDFYLRNKNYDFKSLSLSIFFILVEFCYYYDHFCTSNQYMKKAEDYLNTENYKNNFNEMVSDIIEVSNDRIFYFENKDLFIFINSFVVNNLSDFLNESIDILSNKDLVFKESFNRDYRFRSFLKFLMFLFEGFSEENKTVSINFINKYISDANKEKRDLKLRVSESENIKLFLDKNKHYRKDIKRVLKDRTFNNPVVTKSNMVIDTSLDKILVSELLKKYNFPIVVKNVCNDILSHYKVIVANKEKINMEKFIFIEKLVNEKLGEALKSLITINELNSILSPNNDSANDNSKDYSTLINSLNKMSDILREEIKCLKNTETEKILVLNNYLHAER